MTAPAPRAAPTGRGFSSAAYWEARYAAGGRSGAGSRGRLALYKAGVINRLVADRGIAEVIDFGCGDGFQAGLIEVARYTGIDVSETALAHCRARFADRPGWRFLPAADRGAYAGRYRMAMSLDVIYHLIEDEVFEAHMADLFEHAGEIVLIYATDAAHRPPAEHVRHRPVSAWVAARRPRWRLAERLANPFARPIDAPHDRRTTPASFMIFEAAPPAGNQE